MSVDNSVYSMVSLLVAGLALVLGIYVIRANPYARAARVFFVAMSSIFVGGCLDFLFMNAPNKDSAVVLATILLPFLVLTMGALFYLATFLPYERSSGWFHNRWPVYFVIVGLTALAPSLLLRPEDVVHTSYGWGVWPSLAQGAWAGLSVFFALSADVMLAMQSMQTEEKRVRAQIGIVAVATTAPILYGLFYAIMEASGADLPPILSPGYLFAAIIMAYAVLRYRLFAIEVPPKKEKTPSYTSGQEYGLSLLYLEKKGERAFAAFQREMQAGAVGVVIGRTHPDLLREKYHLKDVPVIWLAQQPGESRIDPTNLGILQHSMLEFYRKHERAVVILEGMEYLLANNPLESILKMLYALDDEVVMVKGLLIVTLDPDILSKQSLAMLMRDLQLVEEGRAGTEI